MDRAWLLVFVGLVLIAFGCSSGLGALRSSWNVANAGAVGMKAEIESLHEADVQAIVENDALTKEQKLEALDHVARKWAPVYRAFRTYRAALAAARVALAAAEAQELAGQEPDLARLAELVSAALTAQLALGEALQGDTTWSGWLFSERF